MRLLFLPSLYLTLSHSINICGWLMLAPQLSAEKGGLVLTAAIAVVKGQGGAATNGQMLHERSWADCPKLIRERGQEKQIREGSVLGNASDAEESQEVRRKSCKHVVIASCFSYAENRTA